MPPLAAILAGEEAPTTAAFLDGKTMLFMAGVVVLAFVILRLSSKAREERRALERERERAPEDASAVKSQADKIMVDLVEAGQEINAQLDTKMRVLNRLVRDAEGVAARLEQHLRRLEELQNGSAPHPGLTVHPTPTAPAHPQSFDPNKDTVLMNPPPGRPSINSANVNLQSNTESGRWRTDIRQKIEQLHRESRTPTEIARMLHISLSEVNLVIDMYEARRKQASTPQ
ncbi:MAG: hypothetical protein J6333_03365 [Planctomycetes bacterium]|nr:hypothetical protein [Planctomycetota bacterium]